MPAPLQDDPPSLALAYLARQLGPRAPASLTPLGEFDEAPLEGEGRTWLFAFDLETGGASENSACARTSRAHIVAVGQTEPNYFPAFGLSSDDAYSFHIGTRFMLEMQVQKVADEFEPPHGRALLQKVLATAAPQARCTELTLAGLFRCLDEYYAVYRLLIDGVPHFAMGCDCPPGFYQFADFPPQTALRLHLGKLIRAEVKAG